MTVIANKTLIMLINLLSFLFLPASLIGQQLDADAEKQLRKIEIGFSLLFSNLGTDKWAEIMDRLDLSESQDQKLRSLTSTYKKKYRDTQNEHNKKVNEVRLSNISDKNQLNFILDEETSKRLSNEMRHAQFSVLTEFHQELNSIFIPEQRKKLSQIVLQSELWSVHFRATMNRDAGITILVPLVDSFEDLSSSSKNHFKETAGNLHQEYLEELKLLKKKYNAAVLDAVPEGIKEVLHEKVGELIPWDD